MHFVGFRMVPQHPQSQTMAIDTTASETKPRRVLVAGDVCLDVVAVPNPPDPTETDAENWRIAGETRTHFLPGGAMLLAKFIRSSRMKEPLAEAEKKAQAEIELKGLKGEQAKERRFTLRNEARGKATKIAEDEVIGPRPRRPNALSANLPDPLLQDEFLSIAERLCREEIVHSLISATFYPATAKPDDKHTILRVEKEHGYSGPSEKDKHPTLQVEYSPFPSGKPAEIIVLDDTGNRFRRKDSLNPWPTEIESTLRKNGDTKGTNAKQPLIVYKLQRPLPSEGKSQNELWNAVAQNHQHNRIVIVSIDDLRATGEPISMGLSWERTALDVVWHLIHSDKFAGLRECPRLVIRLGLDGAILWQSDGDNEMSRKAWLVYDPSSIEGTFALQVPGQMVACGSAFTAALVEHLAASRPETFNALLEKVETDSKEKPVETLLLEAIKAGLGASRRLLQLGYGDFLPQPNYPGPQLFQGSEADSFCDQRITILPGAREPDRAYWRLLDTVFEKDTEQVHTAVTLTATGREKGAGDTKQKAKEDAAIKQLKRVPFARFGKLRTHDRGEIEHFRALHTLLRDYLGARKMPRPLSIAVFGAPGAGKSFGVKQVAKSLKGQRDCKEVEELTFNLSLFQKPEDLAGAFHLVRDVALRGKVSLVFFDEFDTSLDNVPLGWLRHFLAPMQDGEFLDRGAPHPIGQAIFVFAGGTSSTYREFAGHPGMNEAQFKAVKGPDFLSRLRHTLDIPSLNFLVASEPDMIQGSPLQPRGTFNPYGPIEEFPCEAAILLRRAAILENNLREKAPELVRPDKSLSVTPEVLRALLRLPQFEHGNRSFEALLDMSHLAGASAYTSSLLPPVFQVPLHADSQHLAQLIGEDFSEQRVAIAKSIHADYLRKNKHKIKDKDNPVLLDWDDVDFAELRASNLEQADHIAEKLRRAGLWFRKIPQSSQGGIPEIVDDGIDLLKPHLEMLAKAEHDRWCAQKRRQGWAAGPDTSDSSRSDSWKLHNCLFPWNQLPDNQRKKDRDAIELIPQLLADAKFEIVEARRH